MLGWPDPGEVPDRDRKGAAVGPGSGGVCRGRRELGGAGGRGCCSWRGRACGGLGCGHGLNFSQMRNLFGMKNGGAACVQLLLWNVLIFFFTN